VQIGVDISLNAYTLTNDRVEITGSVVRSTINVIGLVLFPAFAPLRLCESSEQLPNDIEATTEAQRNHIEPACSVQRNYIQLQCQLRTITDNREQSVTMTTAPRPG